MVQESVQKLLGGHNFALLYRLFLLQKFGKITAYKNVAFLRFRAPFFSKIGPLDIFALLYFGTAQGVHVIVVNSKVEWNNADQIQTVF